MTKKEEEQKKSKTDLTWRLGNLPTVEEVQNLVEKEIITKDEARAIFFKEINQNEKIELLEDEIKLLKDVIKNMANNMPIQTIIKHVHEYDWPYYRRYPAVTMNTGAFNLNSDVKQLTSFVTNTLTGSNIN